MPSINHTRKPSDDHSKFSYPLRDADGNPIDVSGATSVDLYVDAPDGTAEVSGSAATVEDGVNGDVSYVFGSTELTSPGTYSAEFVINRGAGSSYEHVPPDDNLTIEVVEEVLTGAPDVSGTPYQTRKPGNDYTSLDYTLRDRNGNPIDVSSVTSVTLSATTPAGDGTKELDAVAVSNVNDGTDGRVTYDVQSGDFAEPGDYPFEFLITYGDGSTFPVPFDGTPFVRVTEDVK